MQIESSILNLLLLILKILLDFSPDASHKGGGFSKVLPEKSLEFVPSERNGTFALNLDFVLLSAEIDFIPKKQGRKKYSLGVRVTDYVKIIFAKSTKVVALYLGATIV